jgi:Uma2 family endonuclease
MATIAAGVPESAASVKSGGVIRQAYRRRIGSGARIGSVASVYTPTRARLTVTQFHKMGDGGVFAPEARLELIDGELIEMAPIGPRHMHVVNRLNHALVAAVGKAAVVSVQNPVTLGEFSETQPDLALLRLRPNSETRLPTPDDVILLIEVADTTLQYDRSTKLSLYARHGIREVWIVNVADRVVEIHRDPGGGAYRVNLERGRDDAVAPAALPSAELQLVEVL